MNLTSDGSHRGLRTVSILATAVLLAIVGVFLAFRRGPDVDAPEPKLSAFARPEPELRSTLTERAARIAAQQLQAAPPEPVPDYAPAAPKAPPKDAEALKRVQSSKSPIMPGSGKGPDRFVLRDRNVSAFFTDRGISLAFLRDKGVEGPRGWSLRWGLEGAAAVTPRPEKELPTRINRMVGDPSTWQLDQSSYGQVTYDRVMPGIDMTVESREHGLKYSLQVAPGADTSALTFRYEGANDVQVDPDGAAVQVLVGGQILTENELLVWQETASGRVGVPARYKKTGPDGYAIELGKYDAGLPLMIDPTVSWGTFLGGTFTNGSSEEGRAIAVDGNGDSYVGGNTYSADFPTTAGAFQENHSVLGDAYVARFAFSGARLWVTFIGGNRDDTIHSLKLDNTGEILVAGATSSTDFPTTVGAYRQTKAAGNSTDAFVLKLKASGTGHVWATYIGGTESDEARSVALDGSNNVFITGYTFSTNYPTTPGAYRPNNSGLYDAFVSVLRNDGSDLIWSTYFGGNSYDFGYGIAADPGGNCYISGGTDSPTGSFPIAGAVWDTTANGSTDAFAAKFNSVGGLVWSTFIGGNSVDQAFGIAIDSNSPPAVFIGGYSHKTAAPATDFPVTVGPAHQASYDGFVTKFSATGGLVWSTNLGGNDYDTLTGIAWSAANEVYVCGMTYSAAGFPLPGAYDNSHNGGSDAWVSRLNSAGGVIWSTYFGGSSYDQALAVAEISAYVWITGSTSSANFPLRSEVQSSLEGGYDLFMARLDALVNGPGALNTSTYYGGRFGQGYTASRAVVVDTAGNAFVAGTTYTLDYPSTIGAGATGGTDIVMTKLLGDGSGIAWSTYLGGAFDEEYVYGIAVNSAGDPYATGYTYSTDFPFTAGAFRNFVAGGADAIVTRFNGATGALFFSTSLGGATSDEYGYGIAVDSSNFVYVGGDTYSPDFPVTAGAHKTAMGGGEDAFITKLNPSGSNLIYSTFLGGNNNSDYIRALAVDSSGAAHATGYTQSSNFPTTAGALNPTFDAGTGHSPFVTKMSPSGGGLQYSTFFGGSSAEYPASIVIDNTGAAYVGGLTFSANFPVPNGFQTLPGGAADGFVMKIHPSGNPLIWSTYLGSSGGDAVSAVAVDSQTNCYVTGQTNSPMFPMTPPLLDSTFNGVSDAFVTRINAVGNTLGWSTFVGGTFDEYGYGIAVSPLGHVYAVGDTYSLDFPATGGAFQPTMNGTNDMYVVRISNEAPTAPGSLNQFRSNGTTVIAVGGATFESTVQMKGISSDAEGDRYKIQVEVRATNVAFTSPAAIATFGTDFFESSLVASSTIATVTVSGRTAGTQYHWQARSVDANGVASAWTPFGGNSDVLTAANDFRVDTVLPNISITSPTGTGTYYTNLGSVAVGGTASDDVALFNVTWSNAATTQSGTASGTTTWNVPGIPLTSGSNVITMTATDSAGNIRTAQINVIQDTSVPTATITGPTSSPTFITPATTTAAPNAVTGTYSDNIAVTNITWSNAANGLSGTAGFAGGNFTVPTFALAQGVNNITVTAFDNAGNSSSDVIAITSDPTGPVVTINSPTPAITYATNAASVVLGGSASDSITSVTQVTYLNTTTTAPPGTVAVGTTTWTTGSIILATGNNVINVTAVDAAGNTSVDTITVIRDTAVPSVTINSPTVNPTHITNVNSVALGGTASDSGLSGLLDVRWANAATSAFGTASGTSTWTVSAIGLVAGANSITLTATDNAGNSSTDNIVVTYDPTSPMVSITGPTSSPTYTILSSPITLTGTANDVGGGTIATMSWSSTGAVVPNSGSVTYNPGTGTWAIPNPQITLAGGSQVITITATDTAGNSANDTITVTLDTGNPLLTITTPAASPFYTTAGTVALAGTASDPSGITLVQYRVNGGALSSATGTTSWSVASATLPSTSNTVDVIATDGASNTTTVSITVIRDTVVPGVTISTNGGANFSTSATPLALAGTASDDFVVSTVQWQNNGGPLNSATGTTSWTASIPLSAGSNAITVRATDAAGNFSTDTITVTLDQTPPTVTITGPTTSSTFSTSASSFTISGTVSDAGGGGVSTVTWSTTGAVAPAAGATTLSLGTFTSTAAINLASGAQTVTVTATDGAGNTATDSIIITRDNTNPTLAISSPAANPSYVTASTAALAGTASDANGLSAVEYRVLPTVGFSPATGTTSWSVGAAALVAGSNTVEVRATDLAGNTFTASTVIVRDNTLPSVSISTNSGADFTTNTTPLALAGTASDNFVVSAIAWSNNGGGFTSATGTTSWTASVPLAAGTNTIVVRATDAAGNTSTDTITVTFDSGAPVITIASPATNPFVTGAASITVSGTASDPSGVQIVEYRLLPTVTFTTAGGTPTNWATGSISLLVGTNTIEIRATDNGGNPSTVQLVVTRDNVPPSVAITGPTSASTYSTNAASISLSGTVSDAGGGTVASVGWANAGNATSGTANIVAGNWTSSTPISLVAGSQVITVTATDSVGNTSTDTLTVTVDLTVPVVSIASPATPHIRNTTPVLVSFTATDAGGSGVASVGWTRAEGGGASGSASFVSGTSWNANVPLVVGTNTITPTSTDGAGNTSTGATLVVTLDQTSPTVIITGPTSASSYSTNAVSFTLSGTVSDAGGGSPFTVAWSNSGGGSGTANILGGNWTSATPITLAAGSQVITVTATDTAGNTATDTLTVVRDTGLPTITVTSPGSPTVRGTSPVAVTGTADDGAGSGVASVGWSRAEGGGLTGTATGTTSWNANVPLVVGANTITFTAVDAAGNTSSGVVLIVTLDQTGPTVVITAPTPSATFSTNGTQVSLGGTVSDAGGGTVATVSWANPANGTNGTATILAGNWTADAATPLVAGPQVITVTATDSVGNTSTDTITVIRDNTNPTIAITSPTGISPHTTGANPLTMGGSAGDLGGSGLASVTWFNAGNSQSGTATGTTSWSASIPLITPGANDITMTATDNAGNTSTAVLQVFLNTNAPTVTITTPTSGSTFFTSAGTIALAGTAIDSDGQITGVTYSVDGGPAIAASGSFPGGTNTTTAWSVASIALTPGSHSILVTATDNGATTGTDTLTVIRDNTIPTIVVSTNGGANFTTSASPVVLAGTAADTGGSNLSGVTWANAATSGSGTATGTSTWTTSISLTPGANVITVTATDGAGNVNAPPVTITVTYDVGAPTVTITAPTPAATFQTSNPSLTTLAGTASDNVAVSQVHYQLNGGAFILATGTTSWSVASITLNSGLNTINVRATDSAGNTSTDSLNVTLDNTVPAVAISSPTSSGTYITNVTPLTLSGTASDNLALSAVTWSNALTGGSGTAAGTTVWTATGINLAAGVNAITVRATDTLANFAETVINVTYDPVIPTVSIVLPTAGATFLTTAATVNLSGTAADNVGVASVTASNAANSATGTPSGTTAWSVTGIALVAGTNVITVTATDTAGNTATKVLTVTRDNTNPVVAISTPTSAPTYLAGSSPLTVGGTASDNVAVASVTWVNSLGGSGSATGTTTWSASIALSSGVNTITVTATDTAGNTSTDAFDVTFDSTAPAVTILTPAAATFETNTSPVALAGSASDAQGIASVAWTNAATGGAGTATGTTSWSTSVPLAIGVNLITVTATDGAGNTNVDTVTVTLDTTVPTVTITGPTSATTYVTSAATVALSGTTSDNINVATVSWSSTGAVAPNSGSVVPSAGSWTVPLINLAVGSQVITVTATDTAGNISTDTITVTRDTSPATIAISSPTSSGTYVTSATTLVIGGTAADDVAVAGVTWSRLEAPAASGAAAGTTSWSATVPLVVGTNTFTFLATDTAGNPAASAVIVVTRDNTVPAVQITGPTPNPTFTVNASPVAVSGTASDADGIASVTWSNAATGGNGTAVYAAGVWNSPVPLVIGVNTITVTATDTAGNTSTDAFDVTLDITLPTVTISTPTVAPTFLVSGTTLALAGSASDNVGLTSVTAINSANGSTGTPGGTPAAWTIGGLTLVAGANVITVTATDTSGNTATDIITVTSDGTAPLVAITGPTGQPTYVTNDSPLLLSGTSSDNVSVATITWSNSNGGGTGTATGTSVWSASIPLNPGDNILTVTSTDSAGGTSTTAITVTFDNAVPTVAIAAPTAGLTYETNVAPLVLGGTASDVVGLQTVTWTNSATGGLGTATGTASWSATVPLANGINLVTVTATDAAGNTATDTLTVTFDAVLPSITISSPTALPAHLTGAATVALAGTSADNVTVATVTCVNAANGAVGVVTGTTVWSVASVALAAGDNPITVTVTDAAGNTSSDTITVTQDSVDPVVAFTLPTSAGSAVTNSSPLAIGGTASDNVGLASIAWSNPAAGASGTATGTAAWSAVVPIAGPGVNTITVTATDSAGNTSTAVLAVTLDSVDPTIITTGPTSQPTYNTATSSVTVSGTASDAGGLSSVTWTNGSTGATGTATGTSNWSAAIALTPGVNIITISVTDSAGNVSTSVITVTHDTQSPTITISVPTSSANANSPTTPITIGGSASDNVGVTTVSWTNGATGGSGAATYTAGTGLWSTSVALVEGNNQITVTAIDEVGNSASDTITVSYDPTVPTVNITTPTAAPTFSTTVTPLDFAGTASDNLGLTAITWANTTTGTTGTATGTTAWTASVPLSSGLNTVVFTAQDGVGNIVTDTITVTYDVTPPVVTILNPVPPTLTTQTRPLDISGTAADNVGVTNVTWSNSLTGSSGAATFGAPAWSASIPLIPGTNVITVSASDALGNIGTATLTVEYSHETVVPGLTIDTPTVAPTFVSPSQLVTIAGTASDNVGVTAVTWVNTATSVYGTANGTTAWNASVPLANGDNLIVVTASDDVGNVVQASITISFAATLETNPPSITITAPTTADTFNTTVSPLHLEADAIDDVGIVSVRWTNSNTFGDGDSGWGTFWYASVPLVSGTNVITMTATDTSGNTISDTITIDYNPPVGDPVPPSVSIVTPLAAGTVNVGVPVVDLTGTASDNNAVDTVTFSNSATGSYATADGTTAWSATGVSLNVGVNVITARAVDPAGNVGQTTLVVVYTPPAAAKPVAPVIPAGMCGLTGAEALLLLGACWLRRRLRKRAD